MADLSAFRINGVIDTSKNCLDNISAMCTAAGCWISYDTSSALWTVIINNAGTSSWSFNNSNIVGNINVSGTGIDQLYNAVEIQYPLEDVRGSIDYANLSLDPSLWNPNETYKLLSLQTDLVNNPVQAQYIAQVQLKQNRVDKIVNFTTDYSALGIRAGDLIDLTVDMYGYTNKMFRVISVIENDDPNNGITLDITALEYDATVYDASNLTYTARVTSTGITPIANNAAVGASIDEATAQALKRLGVAAFVAAHAGTAAGGANGVAACFQSAINNGFPGTNTVNGILINTRINFNLSQTGFLQGLKIKAAELIYSLPYGNWSYSGGSIDGYLPCIVQLYYGAVDNTSDNPIGGLTLLGTQYCNSGGTGQVSFLLDNPDWGYYKFVILPSVYKAPGVGTLTPTVINTCLNDKPGGTATLGVLGIWVNATQ